MRIAASTHLNSAPLVYSFVQKRNSETFLGSTVPAQCAHMLATSQCDVALIPVIEYQRIPNLRIIPDVAIASKGQVRSVILAARCPIDEIRIVTLDSSSRTSQTLLRILFKCHYQIAPAFIERMPNVQVGCENMFEESDAALVIGDPAIQLEALALQMGVRIYDLATEWRALTGLPFVFAMWATRENVCAEYPTIARKFIEAKAEGIERIEEIATHYAEELRLPREELIRYLRENINYDLDEENIAGLRCYFRLAHECGFISEQHPLQFVIA